MQTDPYPAPGAWHPTPPAPASAREKPGVSAKAMSKLSVTPVQWQALQVPAGELRLHVRRIFDLPAPPIVLLHGLGVSGVVWQGFGRRLAPQLAAVAPDLRGHGESDAPPSGYRPEDYARDIADIFEVLGVGQAPVLGHSLGSLVALALADKWPDLVPALVLVDPPVDPERRNPDVENVFRLRREPPGKLEEYLLAANPGGGRLLAETLARLFRQAADAAFAEMLAAQPGHPDTWAWADHARQPALIVQADPRNGGVLGDRAARTFAERLPRGQLLKIPGAAHAIHASHPKELADATTRFLSGADASSL